MSWEFLVVLLAVVAIPGADFVVTFRNTIAGGRGTGAATALGVGAASCVQGTLVSLGLGTLIVQSQPVFMALRWLGVGYLAILAVQSLRSAWRGDYDSTDPSSTPGLLRRGLRPGLLTNITNPKMFVLYLSLLPQFIGPTASLRIVLAHAWMLPLIGTTWLPFVVVLGGAMREKLLRPLVRGIIDTTTGLAFLAFSARLALQRE